jgi:hypothetical protein
MAVEETSWEVSWYLDLETGRVVAVDAETRRELERIYAETPEAGEGDPSDLASALEQRSLPPWKREVLLDADLVDREFGSRFIRVPRIETGESYQDMEEFISMVQDGRFQDRLYRAIQGRGAFGRFRDLLAGSRRDQERWFEFKRHRMRERITEWLEEEEIEATVEFEAEPEPVVLEPPARSLLLAEALAFAQAASRLPGVIRIALLGSLTTPEPDPEDADLLVTVADDMDLAPLAALGRPLQGRAQNRNRGADVFLADPRGNYLGRTCPWRECRPGLRRSCDALHCGRRPYLHDDLPAVKLGKGLVAAPPVELWPAPTVRVKVPDDLEQALARLSWE